MPKCIALAAVIAVATLAGGVNARAQTPEEEQACQVDASMYCQQAIPDHAKVHACLLLNRRSISPGCQAVLARHAPRRPRRTR